jgi:hypothetical protein
MIKYVRGQKGNKRKHMLCRLTKLETCKIVKGLKMCASYHIIHMMRNTHKRERDREIIVTVP